MAKRPTPGLPTRQQILDFITQSATPAGKREIARAFGLKGNEKIALKALLKDMADEGLIDSAPGRAFHKMGGLPKVTVLRVVDTDDGQVIAIPEHWEAEGKPPPRLRVIERGRRSALGVGDRILARTEEQGAGHVAHPMKKLARGEEQILGVVAREGDRFWLRAIDKRERRDTLISDIGDAGEGDLVLAEKTGRANRITAKVTEILGDPFAPKAFSLIAIHKFSIPHVFSEELLEEAERVAGLPLGEREDLRHLPIVAIDPVDARDFDDAVWASPRHDGGFDAIVAIADVSFYVRPGSRLDREARKRGNSVYFPDRVVPMLPEQLSADVCSLRAGHDRAAMACHMVIGADGTMQSWRFARAVIRVAANIPYEDAQAAIDGTKSHDLTESALKPLWGCWALLKDARDRRAPLDLDLPERRVVLDEDGRIESVAPRERLDAHRLIEDYMIAANVAAAKALEAKVAPVVYRVHEPPSREKLIALKDYMATFGKKLAMGQVITPGLFNRMLKDVTDDAERALVMEAVLRSQTQAYYGPRNAGHFGLALGSYAHFTSPIRRYADLLVHRALVDAYQLEQPQPKGDIPPTSGLSDRDRDDLGKVTDAISQAERRAMEAERETIDRYVAAWLASRVGEVFQTRITGVQKFGFFATIIGLGGDGLVPVSTLGDERFAYDEKAQVLEGERSGTTYGVGQILPLRLAEANPLTGALKYELEDSEGRVEPRGRPMAMKKKGGHFVGKRGRPGNIRHQGRKKR